MGGFVAAGCPRLATLHAISRQYAYKTRGFRYGDVAGAGLCAGGYLYKKKDAEKQFLHGVCL
jgi:hypothetical protein